MTVGILGREVVLLAVLLALGLGPVAYLPRAWGTAARVALAPAFGLAIASAALTTTAFFVPLRHSLWFAVLPAAATSTFIAIRRRRLFAPGGLRRREVGALVLVAVWGIGVFSLPMLARQSYGPMGYGIYDGPGYGASIFGYARNTNDKPLGVTPTNFHDARFDRMAWGEPWDLTTRYAWGFVFQHNGATTIPAALTIPSGWPAWTLVTPFMAVLSTVIGLGVFAAGMWLFERRVFAACLSAALALGPVLFQIHVDGSLGLLAGLALFPAIMMCAPWICRGGAFPGAISLGVLLAGLQAAYPELLPIAALTIVAICLMSRGAGRLPILGRHGVGLPLLTAGVLGVLLSPRTIPWTAHYLFDLIARDLLSLKGLLVYYNMRPRYVLGWLFQTRDFYTFAFRNPEGIAQLWWGVVAPAAGLVLAGIAVYRRRQLVPFALLIAAAILQALAAWRSDCQYCVQRSLIVVAIALPLLLVGGVFTAGTYRWRRLTMTVVVAVLVLGAGSTLVESERRAIDAAYLPSKDLLRMLPHAAAIPKDGAPLLVEGFQAVPIWSWADLPTTYMALRETGRRLSIAATWNEYGGFSYARTRPFGHPAFTPDYGWVVTRFGALESGRKRIAAAGPLALQRRAEPFDVSPVLGVAADIDDRQGGAWLVPPGKNFGLEQGTLTALVSGPTTGTAWVEVVLQAPPGTSIAGPPGMTTGLRPNGGLSSCVPVPADGPVRLVTLTVTPPPAGFVPSSEPNSPVYRPSHSIRLLTLRGHARPCPE